MSDPSILTTMIRKLQTRAALDPADCDAILELPYVVRDYEAPAYIVREGERPKRLCSFIIRGLAMRQKVTATGGRQIVSIHMAGDFIDLQHLFLNRADHSVQALTRLTTADIDRHALQALAVERPNVGQAMWVDALIEGSIFREWIVNVGRRDARSRIAHLLCEFATRAKQAGIATDGAYELPLTQEQIGDAVGLTSVHVNRTLKGLVDDGLIQRDKRTIRYIDWKRLAAAGDFSALYLHSDQVTSAND